jgi:hypothetical protein
MNGTGIYHLFWITLVIANFVLQLWYFFNDRNLPLFLAKKITTPLLLFGGLAVVIVSSGGFPIIPGIVLLTMGLGELGIEGSTTVESKADRNRSTAGRGTPWTCSRIRICNYDGPVYYHSLPTSGGNSDTAVVVFGRIGDSGRKCVFESLRRNRDSGPGRSRAYRFRFTGTDTNGGRMEQRPPLRTLDPDGFPGNHPAAVLFVYRAARRDGCTLQGVGFSAGRQRSISANKRL